VFGYSGIGYISLGNIVEEFISSTVYGINVILASKWTRRKAIGGFSLRMRNGIG
jgi:hypothetical protein